MKLLNLVLFVCLSAAKAQTPPPPAPTMPDLPEDTVLATFDDGGKLTMGEFKRIYAIMPPEQQRAVMQDRAGFLKQWAFFRKLARMAEATKLDETSPTKERLSYNRTSILAQAEIDAVMLTMTVEPAELVQYYDQNKSKYKQVHVRAIYVAFGKKLSEEDARAKAGKLAADIRGGADFTRLVKENSDDETSRAKDGDFATLRPNDNIPDAVRTAVFALKQGEVSDPVRQPNGFYIFRADEVTARPLSQVRDEIFNLLKQKHFGEWLEQNNKSATIVINSPAFIGAQPLVPAK